MDTELELGKVPFQEAIDFFKAKQPLPSESYTDLVHAMHDRAFVIAGVTRQDILSDVQGLVQQALEKGTPLKAFQKQFAQAIEGKWVPTNAKGEVNTASRARVIFDTNTRSAFNAGRWKQLQALKPTHPFWKYRHGDSKRPRPQHLGWDGLVLTADNPWWQTHYPQNDWGCRCFVDACDDVDLEDMGKTGPDPAPPDGMRTVKYGDHEIQVPAGVGPGWGYPPGENWGRWPALSPQGKVGPSTNWKPLVDRDWRSYERPERLPVDAPKGAVLTEDVSAKGAVEALRHVLGGGQKVFPVTSGGWNIPMVVDAEALGGHLTPDKVPFLGLLPDLVENPREVWAQFHKNEQGKVTLRMRLVKAVDIRGKKLLLVAEGNQNGVMEALTFFPSSSASYLNKQRNGILVYAH